MRRQTMSKNSIRIVCVSDIHNTTPDLPDGDLLIHAGDLTQTGTFAEMQAQLDWLGSQPHKYKIVIGGNHDLILDHTAVSSNSMSSSLSPNDFAMARLNWRGCQYLHNDTVSLNFEATGRTLKVFGSPMTPECGNWAFQYPPIRDVWSMAMQQDCDIVFTHCPPALYRDGRGIGDSYLLKEIRRVKPLLAVCGHAHDGLGVDMLYHESCQSLRDDIKLSHKPLWAFMRLIVQTICQGLTDALFRRKRNGTIVVNAAIAPTLGQPPGTKRAIDVIL